MAATSFFLFKIALVIYSLLQFHINFRKFLNFCEKVTHETVPLEPLSHFAHPLPPLSPLIITNLFSEYMNWLLFYFLCFPDHQSPVPQGASVVWRFLCACPVSSSPHAPCPVPPSPPNGPPVLLHSLALSPSPQAPASSLGSVRKLLE